MDVFNNCRICLQEINHEPIKITRLILKFLENCLQLTNVTKPKSTTTVKQNLCAGCFNKLSEFQDFYELCKDADEFWKNQFEDDTKKEDEQQNEIINFDQSDLLQMSANCNNAETILPEPSSSLISIDQDKAEKEKIMLPLPSPTEDVKEDVDPSLHNFDIVDITEWSGGETKDEVDDDIEDLENNENDEKSISGEIIEYDYQIDQGIDDPETEEDMEYISEHVNTEVAEAQDYPNKECEQQLNEESSNEGSSTLIQDSLDDILDDTTEVTENTFFLETSIDDSGKMKMAYKCQHCDKCFSRIYDIESHYNIHYDVKPYTCGVCGKSFRQKNILTTHQALHFGKKIECTECGKKFARKSQLILHYRMHRDEKPFPCDFEGCNAAFRQRQHLMDHSFIHAEEKNFQCPTCTKSFHTRKRLQDHMYKVHSQHRYRCDLCGKAFLKPHMLKNHLLSNHNVEMDDVSHLKTTIDHTIKKHAKKV